MHNLSNVNFGQSGPSHEEMRILNEKMEDLQASLLEVKAEQADSIKFASLGFRSLQ